MKFAISLNLLRELSLSESYTLILLVYRNILGLWYMETNHVGKMTVSFHIFTFNRRFIRFYFMLYKDSFYEFIATFSTEKK